MGTNAVISNLQQAKSCALKCDCCQQYQHLQSRLNRLEQKVSIIKPVDEQKIIKQSIAGAEQLILPSIGVAVARALLPIDNKIAQLNSKLLRFGNTATQALKQAGTANKIANAANNVGNKALTIGKSATNTASNALAKYGALAALVASIGLSLATLNILGGRIDAIESGQILLSNDISKIFGQILGIKTTAKNAEATAKIATKNATDGKVQSDHALEISVEAYNAAVKATNAVGTITPAIPKTNAQVQATSATATQALVLAKQALALANQNTPNNFMDAETRSKLNQIQQSIGNLNVTLPVALIASAGFTSMITNAAATGVCKSTASGGCLGKSLGNLGKKLDKSLINTAGIGAVSAQVASVKLQTGIISGQVATNGALIKGVGAQVAGVAALVKSGTAAVLSKFGALNALIIAKFAATWSFLTADRTLNVFNAAANLHNAYMLSGSLSQTLFSIVDNIGNTLFKDAGGQSFSVSKILGESFDNWAKGLVGVSTWEGIKAQWKAFNRIYQAGANILHQVGSMVDSTRNISEFVAENTGRIGNALKKWGVVAENAFSWMPEQVDARSLWLRRLENANEAAQGLEMITAEVASTADNLQEITKQADEFKKSIEQSQPKTQVENTAIKARETDSKTASASPDITDVSQKKAASE